MTTRTRVKKIDADTHFLPPVDMEELRQFLPKNYNKEAVNMLLRDAGVFADPNARRGGFRASAAGQRVTGGGNGAPASTRPSELLRKAFYVAVEPDEFCLPQAVQAIGSENFIIGSDYPHPPSTFPNTAAGIENMAGLSEQDKENILGG